MELSPKQQISELIQKAKKILITFGRNFDGDAIGSTLGLAFLLKKMGKETQIVSPTVPRKKFSFLPSFKEITQKPDLSRDYILSIKVPKDTISQLRYEVENERLNVYITAKDSSLDSKNISFEPFRFKYDLIFIINTPDLENLGSLYEDNTELFFETPIVNIDHHSSNEYFGKVNLVEIASSSTAEIIADLASTLEIELDEDIATSLLTGIITATNSFQGSDTTPKAFATAALLMTAGANQQEIIRYLYKTKPLPVLKLWGRIMTLLKYEPNLKFAWSLIEKKVFLETETKPDDLEQIIKEIAAISSNFDIIIFLWEKDKQVQGLIQTTKRVNKEGLAKVLKGSLEKDRISFTVEAQSLIQAEEEILGKIRQWSQHK